MSARRLGALVAAVLMFPPLAAAQCMKANQGAQIAEGLLYRARFIDEGYGGRVEVALILRLSRPACLEGSDPYDQVAGSDRIHVFSTNDAVLRKLRANVGKRIRVSGNPFGEHTAHHHAPIVMNVSEIYAR